MKHMESRESRHSLFLPIAAVCLLCIIEACTTSPRMVAEEETFAELSQIANANGQYFCIVLTDTTSTTSQIYLQRLEEYPIPAIFNIVHKNHEESNFYEQWLYSDSAPVTCIFSPAGILTDIIPGASHKCFQCIEEAIRTGRMTKDLKYYNNFGIEKERLIPLLDKILLCKLRADQGEDASDGLKEIGEEIEYPFLTYIEMQSAAARGDKAATDSLAIRMCSYEGDLDLELYPELVINAKKHILPAFVPQAEARLEVPAIIRLGNCQVGKHKAFCIPLANPGEKPLHIDSIEMSCSCLELSDEDSLMLSPGEKKELELTFTADHAQRIEREIILRNNGLHPIRRIRIIANGQAE